MAILNHPNLSNDQVRLLSQFANAVYQDTVNVAGWETITPTLVDYGLSNDLISGNSYANADILNVFNGEGDANAVLAKQGNIHILAFRGTDSFRDSLDWVRTIEHFLLFLPLFEALNEYSQVNPISQLWVTGHSLGGAMVEHYLDTFSGTGISGVAFASPRASIDDNDTRLLNIGHENDIVYSISGLRDDNANSTTNIYTVIGEEHGSGLAKEHSMTEYIYTTNRILGSAYYDQMTRDSLVIIDRTDISNEIFETIPLLSNPDAFILGEDDDDDIIQSGRGDDVLEGLGGNDYLIGDNSSVFSGNDTLDGGEGDDTLDGGLGDDTFIGGAGNDQIEGGSFLFGLLEGTDTAVYRGAFTDYELEFLADDSIRITDTVSGRDDSDILNGVDFAEFSDKTINLAPGQDLAFVIDTTGSMWDDIASVKFRANDIIDAIFEGDRGFINSRIAVVGYNDPFTQTFLNFTDQPKIEDRKVAAQNAINSITVGGGDDFPEVVNAGLIRALNGGAGEWREEAAARRIILFGDAPPKDPELRGEVLRLAADVGIESVPAAPSSLNILSPIKTESVANNLMLTTFEMETMDEDGNSRSVPVEIFTVLIGTDFTTRNDFQNLAEETGGEFFTASDANEIVDVLIEAIETEINSNPVANNDTATTQLDTPVSLSVNELLLNDEDIDGDSLTIETVNNPLNGTIEVIDDTVIFTPDTGFVGNGGFQYILSDGNGGSDVGIVTIEVTSGDTTEPNIIDGTLERDDLTGTDEDDIITGGLGRDVVTGNGGADVFVYSSLRDAGDIINDFEVAIDKIDLTELLSSLEFVGTDPIAEGYVGFSSRGEDTILGIDPDGSVGTARPRSLLLARNLTPDLFNNADNFIFS